MLGQAVVLGGAQIAISMAVNTMYIMMAGSVARAGTRPGWATAQRWLMATVLGGLAVHMAAGRGDSGAAGGDFCLPGVPRRWDRFCCPVRPDRAFVQYNPKAVRPSGLRGNASASLSLALV